MKEKLKIKYWLAWFNQSKKIKKVNGWFVRFNQSQLNWIRLGVIGIWIIALFNIFQFFNTEESGTVPVYVKGGSIDVGGVYGTVDVQGTVDVGNTVDVQGSVDVDNTVRVTGSVMTW